MDYWFSPHIASAFEFNMANWVDLDNFFAAIPGDGHTSLVLTHSRDIARFIVAVLGIPRWEKRHHLVGDRLTLNDFVRIAEEKIGHTFEKHSDSLDEPLMGKCTLVPVARKAVEQVRDPTAFVSMIAGMGLQNEANLNVLFPDLKTLTVQEAVQICYSRSQSHHLYNGRSFELKAHKSCTLSLNPAICLLKFSAKSTYPGT